MLQQSAHRDVLGAAIPESEESKERFLVELKDRAKASVAGKGWPDAQMLYEKCLKVVAEDASSERAILHSNLSLVQGKMGRFEEAKSSAVEATKKDPSYVKGWWRLGQALCSLEKYSSSLESFEKALDLDPENKALKKECDRLRKLAVNPPKKKSSGRAQEGKGRSLAEGAEKAGSQEEDDICSR